MDLEGLGGFYMMDFNKRPILVFWETTRACPLECRHCRAEAIRTSLPGELTTSEAKKFIYSLKGFGKPLPVLIFTGGDPLIRSYIFELMKYSVDNGIRIGLAPAVSELLSEDAMVKMRKIGLRFVSISLDGGRGETHDRIRGIKGHYMETVEALKSLKDHGFTTQINTVVTRDNVHELPYIVELLLNLDIRIWEVFFLIRVGRGTDVIDISPHEYEDVLNFLYEVTRYGIEVRTVEAPFYRRIILWRREDAIDRGKLDIEYVSSKYSLGPLYRDLTMKLTDIVGLPPSEPEPRIARTRDGKGVIFIAYNGDIYPSGFAPYKLGNVRDENVMDVYRNNLTLKMIRRGEFKGKCGYCEYKEICGGSRARAYAETGDILGEDPACIYIPSELA